MCGIFGIVSKEPIDQECLKRATKLMTHRGPDDFGVFINENTEQYAVYNAQKYSRSTIYDLRPTVYVGLGHTRLSIIDLSPAGHQPMCNEDGTIWITYNGEIYNSKELREILKNRGHTFKSNTDTEVIIHSYEEWGVECLHKFNGMFAFGLWDEQKKTLLLARDRLGIKPIYYTLVNNKFIFSSEIKSILQIPDVKRETDPDGLYSTLLLLWTPNEKTMLKNIFKLLPGHYLIYKKDRISIKKYWDIHITEEEDFNNNTPEKLYELLKESVKFQLISDVPLGAFLSGGLDSSAIVALMTELTDQPVTTYTIAFSKKDQSFEAMPDDSKYARLVANYFETNHREFMIKPDIVNILPQIIWHLDEPIADPAAINTYLICKSAKENGTTVLLSGMGGDEIFGGYRKYLSVRVDNFFRLLPAEFRKSLAQGILSRLSVASASKGYRLIRWAKWFARSASPNSLLSYINNSSYYRDYEIKKLFNFDSQIDYCGLFPIRQFFKFAKEIKNKNIINQMCYLDTKMYLPCLNLTYTDKASMAASVEVRPPFLDHRIVEFAFNLSAWEKIRNFAQKYILKRAMKKVLPEAIIRRPKAPFGAPLRSWIARDLNPLIEELVSEKVIKRRGYLNYEYVKKIVDENRTGKEDNALRIWAFLTLEIWFRTFIDSDGTNPISLDLPPLRKWR
uniref:asparagine synthase (glutamine-hydrolyzing) n=1 Tax=candidate division WOR-3 bacterium TaxID=2052148 RepID=A0A7C4XL58_UNCW3